MNKRYWLGLLWPILNPVVCASPLQIPRYDLETGVAVWSVVEYTDRLRGEDTEETGMATNRRIQYLLRVREAERLSAQDEYKFAVPYHETSRALGGGEADTRTGDLKGLKARYYLDQGVVTILPEEQDPEHSLTEAQREKVLYWGNRNLMFHGVIDITSHYAFGDHQPVPLETQHAEYLGLSRGEIRYVETQTRWGHEVAEFAISGEKAATNATAEFLFWVIQADGRPLLVQERWRSVVTRPEQRAFHNRDHVRHFSYSDLAVSQIAPTVLPALQPRGRVVGMGYSEAFRQITFLSQEEGANTSWLTYWDMDQRKMLNTSSYPGETLLLPRNGKTAVVLSSDSRIFKGLMNVGGGFTDFGYAVSYDPERRILGSGLLGVYPVSLNEQNELEVWNLGYQQLQFRQKLEAPDRQLISVAPDGRVLLASPEGQLALVHLEIDNAPCGDKSIGEAYCEKPAFKLTERALAVDRIDLAAPDAGVDGTLARIELQPIRNVLVFCLSDSGSCGLFNLESGEQIPLQGQVATFSQSGDRIYTTAGIFNLQGEALQTYSGMGTVSDDLMLVDETHDLMVTRDRYPQGFSNDTLQVRRLSDASLVGEIQSNTNAVKQLARIEGGLFMLTGDRLKVRLTGLDLSRMQMQVGEPLPELIQTLTIRNGLIVLRTLDSLIYGSLDNPQNRHLITSRVPGEPIRAVEIYSSFLVYAAGNRLIRHDYATQEESILHELESPVYSLNGLDDEGKAFIVGLARGRFVLPHIEQEMDLNLSEVIADSILVDRARERIVIGALKDTSGFYNPAIPLIRQFSFSGELLGTLEPVWASETARTLVQGGKLWSGTEAGEIIVRDLETGLIDERFPAHGGRITDLLELDEHTVVSGSADGTVKFWRQDMLESDTRSRFGLATALMVNEINLRKTKLLATLVTLKDGDFLISSADGYYWSTPKALHQASFLNDGKVFDYEKYDYWLNRPDRVIQRLDPDATDALARWKKLVAIRQSRHPGFPEELPASEEAPSLSLQGPGAIYQEKDVSIRWSSVGLGIMRHPSLHVVVNEVPLYGMQGLPLGEASEGELTVPLTAGLNRVKAYLQDEVGRRSNTDYLAFNRAWGPEKPDLYVLSIGVSDYQLDSIDLKYAAKDAHDLIATLRESRQFETVHVQLLSDAQATREAIIQARDFLAQSRPEDRVVVFFAGHGFLDANNEYYFGTVDIDPYQAALRGLKYEEISALLDGIPSRYKLLMLDTCHSGEVTELTQAGTLSTGVKARGLDLARPTRPQASLGLSLETLQNTFLDLRASTGATVISAAGGLEYALETDTIANGVFTSTVIRALKEREADQNGDGRITTDELRAFTYREVSRLTQGQQTPTTRSYNLEVDFPLY